MRTIKQLKHYLIEVLPDANIYLFGSRARGDASACSDIDIAIESDRTLKEKLARIRFAIEESSLPYKVDLVDLSQAPYLKTIIQKEGLRWH
ncbi:MAG: nucleotidyltransferase domain-containing protein [Sulfurovum sp.]|nr:nucleotidyltransferase domain-containing protein [Sulfurovum sp.]